MRKKRKIDLFKPIKAKLNPALNKYKDDPSFQKVSKRKLEIAQKHATESNLIGFIKKIEEEDLAKAKRRKSMKSVKNLKRSLKKSRAITR